MASAPSVSIPTAIPPSPRTVQSPTTTFDIVSYYNELIESDSSITPPIAAIESLISLLATTPLTTISETLALLSTHTAKLLAAQRNPIPLSAGTELFQRYLVSSFQQRPSTLANSDFSTLRHNIITNSSLFVKRANEARVKIAHLALRFVREESTIVTYGYSRVVQTLLTHAAESGRYFNVIYVLPPSGDTSSTLSKSIAALNALSIPTSTIPIHALNFALASLPASQAPPQFVTGAAAVLENGSIITQFGTHQVALVARSLSLPFYVAAESYKFVRSFPLGCGQADLAKMGVKQDVLQFSTTGSGKAPSVDDMVEITPPDLISALFTETGIMTPDAVSEELIKLWF
ncbi:uncharacterized protein A1O9_08082 [Exophiala aquamarina CBS 119918]|uniref:Translation initiation factor eIF2B subunit alpha n=1 Tax=Exophiala aquamarina CBS 119918 TaxID=1182545 RepID=A0A072P6K3_9EURO|nr:uncharacterized protein A1O9_08082 [Exophiala aquamarina CBS 119918]KEF55332.1 hypothetical protein A1O9_08082 [Exophiala aquamarina CBS 119918]